MGKVLKWQHRFLSSDCRKDQKNDRRYPVRRGSCDETEETNHSFPGPYCFGVLLCCAICGGFAQAYELIIKTTPEIQRGMPIVVNGTSNLPPGISVDIVLSKSGFTTEELKRETVTLQANKEFSVVFDTSGYHKRGIQGGSPCGIRVFVPWRFGDAQGYPDHRPER